MKGIYKTANRQSGFTIVELLIVIVVLAILTAIAIVAFTGIQVRSGSAVLKSDLAHAARQLGLAYASVELYPGEDGLITDGDSLSTSEGTSFQYTRSNNGAAYCLTATSSRSGVPAFMITHDNTTPREGTCPGHSGPIVGGGGNEIAVNAPIQSITQAQCQALPTFTGSNNDAVRTVTDNRGGTMRTYEIAKLADGKCWMLTNLKLGSTSGPITLTSADSDVSSNFVLPQLATAGTPSHDTPHTYGPVPGDTGSGTMNYGYLYNFAAATAGQTRASLHSGTSSTSSICPSGWSLPTGGSVSSEFATLDIAFGGSGSSTRVDNGPSLSSWKAATNGPFRGVFSGNWYSGFYDPGRFGYFWSASSHPNDSSYAFFSTFGSSSVTLGGWSNGRHFGFGVRCLLQ